jgi:hypothetical protein
MLRRWCIIKKTEVASQLEGVAEEWETRGARPPRLPWVPPPPLLSQATSAPAPGEGSGSELSPNFREYNDVIRSRDCFPEFSVCETVVCRRGSTCSGIGSDVRWCNYGLGFV